MPEAYLVDAVRAPVGRRGGALAGAHPADLGAHVITALVERTGIDPAAVDDVVLGCVDALGPQAGDIARTAWLAAGLPDEVPGVTVDRQCGSSQQAVHFAAQAVLSGTADVVVAGGVQNMSMIPIGYAMTAAEPLGHGDPFSGSDGLAQAVRRPGDLPVPRRGAHRRASGASRASGWRSSRSPATRGRPGAQDEGRFDREIVPYGASRPTRARAATPPPSGWRSWRRCARAAGSPRRSRARSRTARAASSSCPRRRCACTGSPRGHACTTSAPAAATRCCMLSAPIPATAYALKRAGMSLDDIDLVEINEAFASVVLAWADETGADLAKVNVNGGAIALGHPLGATGTRLMTTLLHELERTGGRYGLQTMCEGGGQANVTIIERL